MAVYAAISLAVGAVLFVQARRLSEAGAEGSWVQIRIPRGASRAGQAPARG